MRAKDTINGSLESCHFLTTLTNRWLQQRVATRILSSAFIAGCLEQLATRFHRFRPMVGLSVLFVPHWCKLCRNQIAFLCGLAVSANANTVENSSITPGNGKTITLFLGLKVVVILLLIDRFFAPNATAEKVL